MKQRILKRDKDFFAATLKQVKVSVYSNGHMVDYGGSIENYSSISVNIKGAYIREIDLAMKRSIGYKYQ